MDGGKPYVEDVAKKMREDGIRVETVGGMSIGKAIRNAEKAKVPVMCVIGEREAEAQTLSVRTYADGEIGTMPADAVREKVAKAAHDRTQIKF